MTSLDIIIISYKEKAFHAAFIPDILTSEDQKLLIGSHSLNLALYDDDKGYIDEEAKIIHACVIYDGSHDDNSIVSSLYKYYN